MAISNLEPEQEITVNLLSEIKVALSLHQEVSPRLLYRALDWSMRRIMELEGTIENVRSALEQHIEIG